MWAWAGGRVTVFEVPSKEGPGVEAAVLNTVGCVYHT